MSQLTSIIIFVTHYKTGLMVDVWRWDDKKVDNVMYRCHSYKPVAHRLGNKFDVFLANHQPSQTKATITADSILLSYVYAFTERHADKAGLPLEEWRAKVNAAVRILEESMK